MYPDYTYTVTSVDNSAIGAFLIINFIIMALIVLISYAVSSFLLSRIFKKAGVKQSAAWIPIYSTWKLLELGGQQGFWAPLMLIPGVNIASMIFIYVAMYHVGKKLGKEDWFIILAILIPPVWFIILGFDKSQWNNGISTSVNTIPTDQQPTESADIKTNDQPAEKPIEDITKDDNDQQ
jgi:hypothetical protein